VSVSAAPPAPPAVLVERRLKSLGIDLKPTDLSISPDGSEVASSIAMGPG
jgi:hypothetical protein